MAEYDPARYAAAARKHRRAVADIAETRPILVEQIPLARAAGRSQRQVVDDTGLTRETVRKIEKDLDRLGKPRAGAEEGASGA